MTKEFTNGLKTAQDMATQFADQFKAAVPQVKFNKNGYEIRAQMLEMAQSQVWQDFHARWGQYETSISKDGKEVVAKVEMPAVPGADKVLEAAEKFYNFVNNANTNK
jgi:hypothetical protein